MSTSFWWVNHKMTFKAESEGGYIWAPTETKNKARKETWDNLTRVAKGDVVFSFANAEICAIGTATAAYVEAPRPKYKAKGAASWNKRGYYVPVAWAPLEKRLSPREHIAVIRGLLPKRNSPIRAENGYGNQSCYLATISDAFAKKLFELINAENQGAIDDLDETLAGRADDRIADEIRQSKLPETQKLQLVLARLGQGQFRRDVLKSNKSKCRVTDVAGAWLVTASHIKPWRDADNDERLDHYNGLLLAPHVDRLFDRGYISFDDDGQLLTADGAVVEILKAWGVDPALKISAIHPKQRPYLAYHREHVFKGG